MHPHNPHPIPMDDEGDINITGRMDTGNSRESGVSTFSRAGLRVSSELMAMEDLACASINEPDTLAVTAGGQKVGFSYTSAPERDIFASKKGQPVQTTKNVKVNASIRTRDRSNVLLSDSELMNVYRFETHKLDVKPQDTAQLYPAEFSKVPLKFTEQDREINSKLKVVTGPALGYMYAYGEAQNSETDGKSMLKQLRKYKNGIAPLDKLSLIENELGHAVQTKGTQLSATYSKTTKQISDDVLPHLTRNEYQAIRKQIYSRDSPTSHQGRMRTTHNISNLSLGDSDNEVVSQNSQKAAASITITMPNSVMSASEFQHEQDQLELSNRRQEEEEEEDDLEVSLSDFLTPRSDGGVSEKKKVWLEKQKQRQIKLQTVRPRKVLRSVRKDPTRQANQLPRSSTGEYLVKDYAQGKSTHLFELKKDLGDAQEDQGGYQPSFQHTRNKLKSKKDKVFLKGPEEANTFEITQPEKEDTFDILYSPSTNISVDCHSAYGPGESIRSMPSKYSTGKESLSEKQLTGKPHEIAGYIKTMVMKHEEINRRLRCFVCRKDAFYFCAECAQNYCKLCWNSIGHHENVDPDEVWNNRRPGNTIEYNPNDQRGMHVFLCPDEICQGKLQRTHTPTPVQGGTGTERPGTGSRPKSQGGGTRPRSPPLRSFDFPPPGGVPVVDYRGDYDWNTISKKSKVRKKREQKQHREGGRGGDRGGGSSPPRSPTMHDLLTSPPKTRPPPATSLLQVTNSPVKSPTNQPSRSPAAQSQGKFSPNDSQDLSAEVSPTCSQSSKQHKMSPEHKASHHAPMKATTTKPPPVVMDPGPKTTLIWQVAPTGHTLCPVSSLTPGRMMQPARGITSEFFPKAWKAGRKDIHREYGIYNGVTVATRTIPTESTSATQKGNPED